MINQKELNASIKYHCAFRTGDKTVKTLLLDPVPKASLRIMSAIKDAKKGAIFNISKMILR